MHTKPGQSGYEPDVINVRAVLIVPALVVITGILTYFVAIGTFKVAEAPGRQPKADHALAEKAASADLKDRLTALNERTGGKDGVRLDGAQRLDAEPSKKSIPVFPGLPLATGNSPDYHAEDLRPDRFVTPGGTDKPLQAARWVDKPKNVARIPIDVAMRLALTQLKSRADATLLPVVPTDTKPRESNAGRGVPEAGK